MPAAPRQLDQPVDHVQGALLVGLHHEADAVPAGERRIGAEPLEQVEREFQPVGLLGVDIEADVVAARDGRQRLQPRQQLGHHALRLRAAVARMQRRELYRDAGAVVDAAPGRGGADGMDRPLVGGEVALRIGRRHRRLAEHVVGIAESPRLHGARVGQRLADGLAADELLAHQPHREIDAAADQRLAAAADQAGERVGESAPRSASRPAGR